MAAHSRPKDGAALLAYVPGIRALLGKEEGVAARNECGHDVDVWRSTLRDELGDEIGAEALDAALAAVPGFLDAAERRLRRRDRDRVDADHAGFQRVADRRGRRGRSGEGVGREPERQRIGALDHLVEGL